jgi:Protein of unknown function (DUF1566)/PEP-CTERM motif
MKKIAISITLYALLGTSVASHAALEDRGGGLIYDNDLNITWLSDANYAKTSGYNTDGKMNWTEANTWAANLVYHDAIRNVDYSDWRLPTTDPVCGFFNCTGSEMGHLFYQDLGGYEDTSLTNAHNIYYNLFHNINTVASNAIFRDYYWSSTEDASHTGQAWAFSFGGGNGSSRSESQGWYAIAVRPGDVAPVPEPETYAMFLAGLGLLGWRMRNARS